MADISSKVRLVVSDVDGTLVGADCVMGEGIRQLAQLLSEQHIAFTLASGRPVGMLEEYKKALNITLPVVASNGAAGHDGEKFIWEELLPADAVRRTVEEADRMGYRYFSDLQEAVDAALAERPEGRVGILPRGGDCLPYEIGSVSVG